MNLYTPADVLEAHRAWGATCGPAALAAVLGIPVMELQRHFQKPWTTPTVMQEAVEARKQPWATHSGPKLPGEVLRGVAFVQLHGEAWDKAAEREKYRHTHWIGIAREGVQRRLFIYDVNAGAAGGWVFAEEWKSHVLPAIAASHKGASGGWSIRLTVELKNPSGPKAAAVGAPGCTSCGAPQVQCARCLAWWCERPGHLRHRCEEGWLRCSHGSPYWEGQQGRPVPPDCCRQSGWWLAETRAGSEAAP
jgi:hypothetical protein